MNFTHGRRQTLILCFLLSLLAACDQGTAPPPPEEPFSFRVTVKDQAGAPRPNVRVSVYPPFDVGWIPAPAKSPAGILASSTINFAVATPARVTLSLLDLDGTLIQKLQDNTLRVAGLYAFRLALQRRDGARVMMCRFVATDTATGTIAFRDSVYVTLWQPDPEIAVLGYTSGSGTLESRDTLAFPYVLSLPPIAVTRDDPTPLGWFSFPDSCIITLTDTATAAQMTFGRRLVHRTNEITVTWNPAGKVSLKTGKRLQALPGAASSGARDPFQWRLYQNYPNPFN
jgi:hypothetical protein